MKIDTMNLLRKMLVFRLKIRKSEAYLNWFRDRFPNSDPHHLLQSLGTVKLNDYFLVDKIREQHMILHSKPVKEEDFEEMFIKSIENLLDYVQYLEQQNNYT